MDTEIIILGENMNPPEVCLETSQDIYDCVRSDEFEVDKFNAMLMAVVTYLDAHDVEYGDKALPWAETMNQS